MKKTETKPFITALYHRLHIWIEAKIKH